MRRLLTGTLCVLMLGCVTGCALTSTGSTGSVSTATATASTATATAVPGPPTPTNVPSGWQVYSGQHFTIAYPGGWTMTTSDRVETGLEGDDVQLTNPTAGPPEDVVTVLELWGYSQSQLTAVCQLSGTTVTVTVAGLSMQYTVGEGVHRNWLFVNSDGVSYTLDALDLQQPSSMQQMDNSVLATFRPDDPTSGCPSS